MDVLTESAKTILKIEVGNVKSRVLFEPSVYNDRFQSLMLALDYKTAFLLPNVEQNKNYNTFKSDGTRLWDGKKHLFNPFPYNKYSMLPFQFYTGKIKEVLEIIYKHNFRANLIDVRKSESVNTEKFKWTTDKILFDYQEETAQKAVECGRGLIRVGTGGGKTIIGASIIYKLGVAPFLFFVTTKDLMYQAHDMFQDIFGINIGLIGDGKCDIEDINVCTIQTCAIAFGKLDEYKEQCKSIGSLLEGNAFDKKEKNIDGSKYELIRNLIKNAKGVIADEVHHASSATCSMILELCENAFFRYGLGATIQRDDGMEKFIEALFGEYICDINASFLIEKNRLIAPKIHIIPIEKYLGECESYASEYKTYIDENEFRNDIIAKIANETIEAQMPTLILVKHIKHGLDLKNKIKDSVFIQGAVNAKKRKDLIQEMRDGKIKCILASLHPKETVWIKNAKTAEIKLIEIEEFANMFNLDKEGKWKGGDSGQYNDTEVNDWEALSETNDGNVVWKRINGIIKHENVQKNVVNVKMENGEFALITANHSLIGKDYESICPKIGNKAITSKYKIIGSKTELIKNDPAKKYQKLSQIKKITLLNKQPQYVYDLSVDGTENFYSGSGILMHNTSLADEGLDIPCLECLILAGSGKSIVKTIQRIGRVIRKYEGKKRAVVYDFIDSSPILHSHSLKRKRLYCAEPRFTVYDLRYKKQMQAALLTQDII